MGMVTAQAVAAPEAEQAEQAISSDIHGFELQRQQWVAEYNSTVLLYKHKKTGLLIHIHIYNCRLLYSCVFRQRKHALTQRLWLLAVSTSELLRDLTCMAFRQILCHGTNTQQEAKHSEWH